MQIDIYQTRTARQSEIERKRQIEATASQKEEAQKTEESGGGGR